MSHRLAKHLSEEEVSELPLHKQIALGEQPRKPVSEDINEVERSENINRNE